MAERDRQPQLPSGQSIVKSAGDNRDTMIAQLVWEAWKVRAVRRLLTWPD